MGWAEALCAFDYRRTLVPRFVKGKLFQLLVVFNAIEIAVPEGQTNVVRIICLGDRESRAGHLALEAEALEDAAAQRRLSRPQFAEPGDRFSSAVLPPQPRAQGLGGGGIRHHDHCPLPIRPRPAVGDRSAGPVLLLHPYAPPLALSALCDRG